MAHFFVIYMFLGFFVAAEKLVIEHQDKNGSKRHLALDTSFEQLNDDLTYF